MNSAGKLISDIKWNTRQRLQYIEVMAYYTGVISRSDIAQTFGISDAAATKDLKLYNDLIPGNLSYQHSSFGFEPAEGFSALFANLEPATTLPMITDNQAARGNPGENNPIYGIDIDTLPMPTRLPSKEVLAQITRAIKQKKKLLIRYHSLSSGDNSKQRLIEPHSLANTGQRWHVRAYNEESYDFRDFVLSRINEAKLQDSPAESSMDYDDEWMEFETIQLAPHPGLSEKQQQNLLFDYGATGDFIEITTRRALIGYLVQRLSIDTTHTHSLNPNAFQLVIINRETIEPFAAWAFLDSE